MLPAGSARHGGRQIEPGGGLVVVGVVAGADDHLQPVDASNAPEGEQGPTQDRLTLQEGVLLGQRAAKAASPASGDNQDCTGGHRPR